MSTLYDRPNGPATSATGVAGNVALNTQAGNAGPLPVTQALTAVAETLILSAINPAVALTVQIPPVSGYEQTVFDLVASGYLKTTNVTNLTLKVYSGSTLAGTLLGTSGAIAQNTASAPYFVRAKLIYDSVSGKLDGAIQFFVNHTLVAEVVVSNTITGISDNGTGNGGAVATFCLSLTSSAAAAGNPTTINVQKFSVG